MDAGFPVRAERTAPLRHTPCRAGQDRRGMLATVSGRGKHDTGGRSQNAQTAETSTDRLKSAVARGSLGAHRALCAPEGFSTCENARGDASSCAAGALLRAPTALLRRFVLRNARFEHAGRTVRRNGQADGRAGRRIRVGGIPLCGSRPSLPDAVHGEEGTCKGKRRAEPRVEHGNEFRGCEAERADENAARHHDGHDDE